MMADKIAVRAVGGRLVPKEESSRRYIGEETVEVPRTAYYLRRLFDQELVLVEGDKEYFVRPDESREEVLR
jgi:hypothetical protein